MSGPVAHVDDDEDQVCDVELHKWGTCNREPIFNSRQKTSTVFNDDLKTGQVSCEKILFNGDLYFGSWQGSFPQGTGKYLWSDGCMYEGEWWKGKKAGKGKISWPSGATYEGDFLGGLMHGLGTYTDIDGATYKGNWKMNEKHGFGTKSYANGDVYEGSWKHGLPEGPGRYIWNTGSEYMGDWKSGIMSGHGVLAWINGDTFDGQWLYGLQHGHGVWTCGDGSTYMGTWNNGLKDGRGIFYPPGSLYLKRKILNESLGSEVDVLTEGSEMNPNLLPYSLRSLQYDTKKRWRPNHSASAEKFSLSVIPIDYKNSIKINSSSLERHSRSVEGLLERVSALEPDKTRIPMSEFDERNSVVEYETNFSPIVDREYVQGVLINELIKENLTSCLNKRARQWQRQKTKEIKRPGETIFKGHRSYDLMLNLQLGIRYTVGKITPETKRDLFPADFGPKARLWMNFPREGSQLTPPHQATDFKWKDYCPMVFRRLREMFKIDTADYMLSICGNDGLRELSSPGKSGSVFYLSNDDHFIIKTMRKSEVKVLLGMLPCYYNHVCTYENTLITKFFGLHRVRPAGGPEVHFVVMGNMFFTELCIHRRFDIKGSSQGRSADIVENDDMATLKDLDLDFVFHLEPTWQAALLKQIQCDCEFLEANRIMDYSLLLGVHFRAPQYPAVFSAGFHSITPADSLDEVGLPGKHIDTEARFVEEEVTSKSLILVVHEPDQYVNILGPHVRGSPLRASVTGDQEVDLLLPGTARLRIQLGVNMPARADHRPLMEDSDPHPQYDFLGRFMM